MFRKSIMVVNNREDGMGSRPKDVLSDGQSINIVVVVVIVVNSIHNFNSSRLLRRFVN